MLHFVLSVLPLHSRLTQCQSQECVLQVSVCVTSGGVSEGAGGVDRVIPPLWVPGSAL